MVATIIENTLTPFGEVKRRSWGDVISIEVKQEGRKTFSFQIAQRTVQLEPTELASGTPVPLDSLADLIASKMVALIERGAPRDFRDIFAVCVADLATPQACWSLWKRRQVAADSDVNVARASLAITTHLARIAQQRPLDQIDDESARQAAQALRSWFTDVFLHAEADVDDDLVR